MAEIHFDSPMTDSERREAPYRGAIFVYRPTAVAREFCAFADSLQLLRPHFVTTRSLSDSYSRYSLN